MISEVKSGEKILAAWANKIVDACNGEYIPTNGSFVKTPNGVIETTNSYENSDEQDNVPTLFDIKNVVQYSISAVNEIPLSSSPVTEYTYIYVGKDINSLKDNIRVQDKPVDKVVLGSLSSFQYELSDNVIYGMPDDETTIKNPIPYYDGWINTGIFSDQPVKGAIVIGAKQDGEESPISTDVIFCITDKPDDLSANMEQFLSQSKDENYVSFTLSKVMTLADRTHSSVIELDRNTNSIGFSQPYSIHKGPINISREIKYQFPWEFDAALCSFINPTYQIGNAIKVCNAFIPQGKNYNDIAYLDFDSDVSTDLSIAQLPALSGVNYLIVDPLYLSGYLTNNITPIQSYINNGYMVSFPIANVISGEAYYLNRYPQILGWESL